LSTINKIIESNVEKLFFSKNFEKENFKKIEEETNTKIEEFIKIVKKVDNILPNDKYFKYSNIWESKLIKIVESLLFIHYLKEKKLLKKEEVEKILKSIIFFIFFNFFFKIFFN
jgi:predicted translin family RNA/ssDNA-binding protein